MIDERADVNKRANERQTVLIYALDNFLAVLNRPFMGSKSPTQAFPVNKELWATSDECVVMPLEAGADVNMEMETKQYGFNACGTSRSDNVVHYCVV